LRNILERLSARETAAGCSGAVKKILSDLISRRQLYSIGVFKVQQQSKLPEKLISIFEKAESLRQILDKRLKK
jgi:hypothetical protein